MSRFIHMALIAGASVALLLMAGLIWLRYPDNHGAGPFAFMCFFGVLLVLAMTNWAITSKPPYLAVALSLIGFATTFLLDRRNIMVDYDEWIKRGMPEWGVVNASVTQQSPMRSQPGESSKSDP